MGAEGRVNAVIATMAMFASVARTAGISSAVMGVAVVLGIAACAIPPKDMPAATAPRSPEKTTPAGALSGSTPAPGLRPVPYDIVRRWQIPNGREGRVVVINPAGLNEAAVDALGEQLRADTRNERNAFIYVYSSREGAALRDKARRTPGEDSLHDRAHLGSYARNANTGFHQIDICPGGRVSGVTSKDCISINYVR